MSLTRWSRIAGAVSLLLACALATGCALLPDAATAPADYAAPAGARDATAAAEAAGAAPEAEAADAAAEAEPAEDAEPAVRAAQAVTVRVVDGDTAVFRFADGREEKTRFIGVDTPESTNSIEPFGKEAAAYTRSVLSPGRKVWLEVDAEERDRYGRLLAYVWLERPGTASDAELRAKQFNAHLALEGYAQQMTIQPNSRYADYYTRYVREARRADRGLWGAAPSSGGSSGAGGSTSSGGGAGAGVAVPPPAASPVTAAFIGNRNTGVFHFAGCSSVGQMNPANKVPLASRDAAVGGGYRPCGRCNP